MANTAVEDRTNSKLFSRYKVLARNGLSFESEILGVSSTDNTSVPDIGFTKALVEAIDSGREVSKNNIKAQRILKLIQGKLRSFGIEEVKFYQAVDTSADVHHAVDAFFYLKKAGVEYVVTIDLFFLDEKQLINIVREFMPIEFQEVKDKSQMTLRHILSQHYLRFQGVLDGFKGNYKKTKLDSLPKTAKDVLDWERYENHFILTPIEIGGKCLRAFIKEIAKSFKKQIEDKEREITLK